MARQPGVWLRKGTPWFYTTIDGEQIRLSQDAKEAQRLFHGLMAKRGLDEPAEPRPAVAGIGFKKLADEYLKATRGAKCDQAFGQQVKTLQSFGDHVKRTRAADLKPHMVSAWLDGKAAWAASTKALNRKTIKACLNWAVKEGHLAENPLAKMVGGDAGRRDRVLSAEEKRMIAAFVSPDFRDFLRAVELTGCRPFSEMAQLTTDMVDLAAGTATVQQHKNRKKTGRPRVIFLVPELVELLRARVERYPAGPLFRSRRGARWNAGSACKWFTEVGKKLGIDAHLYAYRASFVTEALTRGVPVEVVAELCGNTPQIIYKHYAHVGKDTSAMRAAAAKAVGG